MELKVTRYDVRDNGVATVWLHRPGRGNSWTSRMNAELRWVMATLDADPAVRAVVLTGSERQFCVGADTKALDFYTETDEAYADTVNKSEFATPGYGVNPEFDHDLVWMWGLRLPVIAAINGACAGIAVALAGFCDLRYAAAEVKFTTSTPRLGLPAEYGLAWLLPRLVGVTNAADILITGRVLRSEEMLRIGYLNGIFARGEEFLDSVYEVANSIAEQVSPASATVAKRQLYSELLHSRVGAAIENSKELIEEFIGKPDFKEGVAAMAQRRSPQFPPPSRDSLPLPPPGHDAPRVFAWSRDTVVGRVGGRDSRVYRSRRTAVAQLLLDARRWNNRIHVIQGDQRLTFAEHERVVARMAAHFRSLGVRKGDYVALFARNHAECTMAYWAAHTLGAVVVLCNAWWSSAEVAEALATTRPALVVHDADTADRVPADLAQISVDELGALVADGSDDELTMPEVAEDDPALVLFTSGSTETPKGVLLSQRSVVSNIHNLLLATKRLPQELDAEAAASVNLVTVPLFHLAGVQVMSAALITGARLVYQDGKFNAAEVLRLIETERVTTWGAVPAMVTRVMEHEAFASTDTSSMRSIPLGGSASTPAFRAQVRERFPNLRGGGAGSMYGLTEAGGLLAMGTARDIAARPGSVGKVLPPVDVRIADPNSDGNGEILVNAPGVMSGYVDDALQPPFDDHGWLRTGDVGHLDHEGYLYLSGRSKDIVIRGGENISCPYVAAALATHPAVAEAAVVALPHAELGEQVAAAITVRSGFTPTIEDLRAHADTQLGRFQVPTRWWLSHDSLPTNDTGKVIRREVERQWLERGNADIVELAP